MNETKIKAFIKSLEEMPELTEDHLPAKEDLVGHVQEQINATKQAIGAVYVEVLKLTKFLALKDAVAVEYAKGKLAEYAKELRSHKIALESFEKVLDDLTQEA